MTAVIVQRGRGEGMSMGARTSREEKKPASDTGGDQYYLGYQRCCYWHLWAVVHLVPLSQASLRTSPSSPSSSVLKLLAEGSGSRSRFSWLWFVVRCHDFLRIE